MSPPDPTPPPTASNILPGEGEERVTRILESITDGFTAFDRDWRFIFQNEAANRLLAPHLGDPRTLLGQVLWEALPETCGTNLEREYRRAVMENVPVELEYFHVPWGRWFSIRGFPIRGGGLSVYFRDVTAEARAAAELRESERQYRTLFASIDEGFCVLEMIWDAGGRAIDYRFIDVNPAFEKQTGVRGAAGHTARELIPGLEECWFESYGQVARTGQAARFIQCSEAMGRWFDVYAFPFHTSGRPLVALLFSDITARLDAEREVARLGAESRARLAEIEALLEVIPVGIGLAFDRECQHIRTNRALADVLGVPLGANASKTALGEERPAGFRVFDDAGSEVADDQLPMQVAAREGREVREREFNVVHSDGRMVRLLEYAAPLFDERGQPRGSVGAFVDITERRQAEERQRFLLRLEEAIRPLRDFSEIVGTAARLLGEHLHADRCAYADLEPDQNSFHVIGDYTNGVASMVGHFRFSQFGSEVLRLMRRNTAYISADMETHQPPPEDMGPFLSAQIRAVICVPLHKEGRFVAAMALHQKTPRRWREEEVTLTMYVANRCWEALERARVSRVLQESEERFRTLADSIAQLAWMADAEGAVFWYNQRWFAYIGNEPDVMQRWEWDYLLHPDHRKRVLKGWRAAQARGGSWEDTFPLRGADGLYRWFLTRAFPIRDGQGQVLRWFGTNTDVTDQRAAADALANAKEEAEAANRTKDDFLAALSHELRTPLTPVLLSAGALQEDERLPGDVREQLAMIRRNIELEARLIEDLLDLTRIARGKLTLHPQDCDAHTLLRLALEIIKDEADARWLGIDVELAARHSRLRGDPARLQQVFWNLLKNAVKFTPPAGRVTVHTFNDEATGQIVFAVTDTGVGIAPEALERIFLPFEQAGRANDHRFGGLGLGLSISRTIVEMHGGAISATSAGLDCGATFRVALPVTKAALAGTEVVPLELMREPGFRPHFAEAGEPVAAAATATPGNGRPLRLLLVEDNESTLSVLTRLLRRAGHTVHTAVNVASARAKAEKETLDVVLSDIGLPDGTGIELMESLRSMYGLRGIALSGYGTEEDRRRTAAAGFVAHLTKPVDFGQIRQALAEFAPAEEGGVGVGG